jgi:succinate dehydrogenase/fumarate reductase flavoprotein subunit
VSAEGVACDVLVAGSGAAGFATALTAHLEGLDVIMVEKAPLLGGTTAYSAGVVWIPVNSAQRAAGLTDPRQAALDYLAHHVGNRLDRARAEAYLDNAPAMLDCFAREEFAVFSLVPTWADYHPDEPGASQGGRSLADARVPELGLHQTRRQPTRTGACLRHRPRGARSDPARL